MALDAVLLAYAKVSTMPTSASSARTVAMDTGVGDELRASGSCEAALNVKSTAGAASCVAPYVQWRSVSRGIFRTISP